MNSVSRLFLLIGLATGSTVADPILTYTETNLGGGFFDVLFTAANNFDPVTHAGTDLYDVVFDFPVSGFLLSLPSGWMSNPAAPGTSMEAFSTFPGPPPIGTDIGPGQSLSGFEFLFETSLGNIPFTYSFTNPAPGPVFVLNGSSTPTFNAVPEPKSTQLIEAVLALMGISLLFEVNPWSATQS
jgi:hypothetical protein